MKIKYFESQFFGTRTSLLHLRIVWEKIQWCGRWSWSFEDWLRLFGRPPLADDHIIDHDTVSPLQDDIIDDYWNIGNIFVTTRWIFDWNHPFPSSCKAQSKRFWKYFQDTSKVQLDGIVLHFIARKTICVLRLIKFYWTWYKTIDLQGWQVCNEIIQHWTEINFAYENLEIVNFKWSNIFGHNSEWNSNCIFYLSTVFKGIKPL